ncbi:hypothetical protein [Microbacterium sp. zg.Y909]|uniref:hypothetical protein n=1 Tax=Microbacterium sp. zg.Y909 TaxID=2969413 RepID=UPI00214B4A8C|nr:hypothetical protein [Microbacterium sp. zg.Y909]MCR2825252.1 hypothetical protein [Microbacterium sp. zg.Y909]
MRRLLYLSAFLLVPALSAVTPLVAVPAITASAGAGGWEAYALGISIGSLVCVIVELGWPLTGPQRVAAEAPGVRWATLLQSLRTRAMALIVLAPVAIVLAVALTQATGSEHETTTVLMAFASAAAGLSCSWYFTGVGRPLRILTSDAIPRALMVTVAAIAVANGAPIWVVPVGYLLAVLYGPAAALSLARDEREGRVTFTLREDLRSIRSQWAAMSGRSVAALYMALPVTLVAAFAPSALAVFAAADRLMRMALTVLLALPNAMQNWVGSASSAVERRHRIQRAILVNTGMGVVAGAGFALLAPWVSTVLFSGTVDIDPLLAVVSGGVLALVCVSRATGPLGLVRYGRIHTLTVSATAAAVVGVPAICVFAALGGAIGAALGEVVAEITAISIQAAALGAAIRRDRGSGT